ncbi:MAG: hypothetical protein AAFP02_21850, partial [Bacteroidota bacterium]
LGFMSNMLGKRVTHFPRIPIEVDGQTIQTLFDTGASIYLSDSARVHFDGAAVVGGSFIVARIFDQWRENHPDWTFVKGGDAMVKTDLIEVPKLKIANYEVGPVWFARRADTNFDDFMSQWMDQPIEGAIGGSAFQYFKTVLIDYPAEKAWFER